MHQKDHTEHVLLANHMPCLAALVSAKLMVLRSSSFTHSFCCLGSIWQVEQDLQAQYKTGEFTAMSAMDALPPIQMDMGLYGRGSHASTVHLLFHNPGLVATLPTPSPTLPHTHTHTHTQSRL